jgi:uncharacterized protein
MSSTTEQGTAVVTGASGGIGAVYARRLAERGHDLVLVARNGERLHALAAEIGARTGRRVDVVVADLTDPDDLRAVERRLREDETIDVLVNNAGAALFGGVAGADAEALERLISLNVTALTRLTTAVTGGLVARGNGSIVNVSSILALNVLPHSGASSGTKSYVLSFTQALQQELAGSGVRAQAVLFGAVATELWDGSGVELDTLPAEWVMTPEDAVDASLSGLDHGEPITLPALPDVADWDRFEEARLALVPNLSRSEPAARYRG